MELTKALRKMYEDNALTERIYNPFYIYCVLSDLCHGSFEEMRMVKVYYGVNRQINIFKTLIQTGIKEGNLILKSRFNELVGVDYNDYKRCVIATTLAVQPDYEFSRKSRTVLQQVTYKVGSQSLNVISTQPAKKNKKKSKPQKSPEEKLEEVRKKLADSFYDYLWHKYANVKPVHFIRRKRILDRGYQWYFKILGETDINNLNSLYQKGKNALDAI